MATRLGDDALWGVWREVMRAATRYGKLKKQTVAKIIAKRPQDFIDWAVQGDDELAALVVEQQGKTQETLF